MKEALKMKEQKMQQEREEHIGQHKIQTVDSWLQTIVFRVRKQWDYCCLVPICMLKTMVCSCMQSAF